MKRNRPMLFIITWTLAGLLYSPIFIASWLLHIIARALLGVSYIGMLDPGKGIDIMKSLFRWNPNL